MFLLSAESLPTWRGTKSSIKKKVSIIAHSCPYQQPPPPSNIHVFVLFMWFVIENLYVSIYLQGVNPPGAAPSHPSRRKATFMSILPSLSPHLNLIFRCYSQRIYMFLQQKVYPLHLILFLLSIESLPTWRGIKSSIKKKGNILAHTYSSVPPSNIHVFVLSMCFVIEILYVSTIYRESTHLARHRVIHREERQHACPYYQPPSSM